jgi:2-polyprenyl-3-methyl-5-hydroxy-6-metoxy-1,4-benzoquinol methylase
MGHDIPSQYQQQLEASRQIWNAEAASFDEQTDHGLRDPLVLVAWTNLLRNALPANHAELLDIGCGTGSLSIVLAGLGCHVTGIDFSPEMIALAVAKAKKAHYSIQFQVMDAAFPQLPPRQFDAAVCRHLLWALPEPSQVLQRWVQLLKPGGRLILIEGYWHTGAGLHSQQILDLLPASLIHISVQNLSDQSDLWGGQGNDERYLIWAELHA